ncbi:ParM/StbA family protein [Oceanobacillus profundus]|uniref:ParM/StbA family protein n=1 Tax=Oceanobacillus profundus TaxID=372463 RepID=A0A417YGR0_9BACI|nr:ParM/StbA family protein [Oceanobacillus profundus]MBR3119825.1 ParM/StbA family protein [Oceanobacillus sp.]RHW31969.1 ParM/StbA family protein [Oceanobacillus profundus]
MANEKKQMHLVAVDVGFGGLKYMSNSKPEPQVIPSGVVTGVPASRPLLSSSDININELVVQTEEGTYFVGENALGMPVEENVSVRTEKRNRAHDVKSRVLFHTGIGLSLPDIDGKYEVTIVTGLPNSDYDKSIHDDLRAFLEKDFTVEFYLDRENSIKKEVKVAKVIILRQPEGTVTYNQFRFDPESFIVPSNSRADYLGVIDFGHVSTDYALFRNGVVIEDPTKNKSTIGVTEVYKRLRQAVELKFSDMGYMFHPSDQDLDYAIQTNHIRYRNQDFDISDEIEMVVRDRARPITDSITTAWGNEANRLQLIIATGGGAHVYAQEVRRNFESENIQGFIIMENSRFTNLLGFYMYGALELSDTYGTEKVMELYVNPVKELHEHVA